LRSSFTYALSRSKGAPDFAVAFGPNGDTYLAGRLDKDLTFGSQQPRYRSLASFVARLTPSGKLVWLAISDNTLMTGALTVDAKGNAYVVGAYLDKGQFGDIHAAPFQGVKGLTSYIAKIDPKGSWVWAKGIGGFNRINHIKADHQGNTIIAGTHIGPLTIGAFQLKATTDKQGDIFVAKVGPKGQVLWAQDFKETHSDAPYALALDINGNIYLTGVTGIQKLPSRTTHNGLAADLFVRKMDVDGQTFWLKRIQSPTSNEEGRGIAVDTKGNVYVVGIYSHTLKLGETLLSNGASGLYPKPFIAKLDYKGNWLWAKGPKLTSPNKQAFARWVAVNAQGHIVLTGTTTGIIDFGNEQRITPTPKKDTINDFLVQYQPDGRAIHTVMMDPVHIQAISISAQNTIHLGMGVRGSSFTIGQTTLDLRNITRTFLSIALPMKR
jgi:hypothetical protein